MASIFCGSSMMNSPKSLITFPFSSSSSSSSASPSSNGIRRNALRVVRVSSSSSSSAVDSGSSPDLAKRRMERAWIISQQPRPVACSSCASNGHVECKWCGGTGFFIIGNNMLCEVPSRNTSCIICAGKGSTSCSDCKGTGFRAKWLDKPPQPR